MKRIITAATAALVIATGVAVYAQQATFPDVPAHHPRYADIESVYALGFFGGKADGTFAPDDTITTEQMTRVLDRAYPDGMTRAEFATFIIKGDEATFGSYGSEERPLPVGVNLAVSGWRITVLDARYSGTTFTVEVAATYVGTGSSTVRQALSAKLVGSSGFYSSEGIDHGYSFNQKPATEWMRAETGNSGERTGWIEWEGIHQTDVDTLKLVVSPRWFGNPVYNRLP